MTSTQYAAAIDKMLENVDIAIIEMLADADLHTLNELMEETPFIVHSAIQYHIDKKELEV